MQCGPSLKSTFNTAGSKENSLRFPEQIFTDVKMIHVLGAVENDSFQPLHRFHNYLISTSIQSFELKSI